VSTQFAGQGFAAPSFVGGSGGYIRQHCGQRAFSAATFNVQVRLRLSSLPCKLSSTLQPPAVTVASPFSRSLTIVTTQPEAANTAKHRKSRKIQITCKAHAIQDFKALVRPTPPLPSFTPSLCQDLNPKSFLPIDSGKTYTLLLHTKHTRIKFISIVVSRTVLSY
jgi:hypothetical protein